MQFPAGVGAVAVEPHNKHPPPPPPAAARARQPPPPRAHPRSSPPLPSTTRILSLQDASDFDHPAFFYANSPVRANFLTAEAGDAVVEVDHDAFGSAFCVRPESVFEC